MVQVLQNEESQRVRVVYDRDVFGPRYLRNNKTGGMKNLRCFPSCAADGHHCQGFCGRSVFVTLKLLKNEQCDKMLKGSDFLVRSEFSKFNGENRLEIGDKVTEEWIEGLERTKDSPHAPWYKAPLCNEHSKTNSYTFEINQNPKGWHYGWKSNKKTCNDVHCLKTYVFEKVAGQKNAYRVVDIGKSPPFMLYCRRRRLMGDMPKVPASEVACEQYSNKCTDYSSIMGKSSQMNTLRYNTGFNPFSSSLLRPDIRVVPAASGMKRQRPSQFHTQQSVFFPSSKQLKIKMEAESNLIPDFEFRSDADANKTFPTISEPFPNFAAPMRKTGSHSLYDQNGQLQADFDQGKYNSTAGEKINLQAVDLLSEAVEDFLFPREFQVFLESDSLMYA